MITDLRIELFEALVEAAESGAAPPARQQRGLQGGAREGRRGQSGQARQEEEEGSAAERLQ